MKKEIVSSFRTELLDCFCITIVLFTARASLRSCSKNRATEHGPTCDLDALAALLMDSVIKHPRPVSFKIWSFSCATKALRSFTLSMVGRLDDQRDCPTSQRLSFLSCDGVLVGSICVPAKIRRCWFGRIPSVSWIVLRSVSAPRALHLLGQLILKRLFDHWELVRCVQSHIIVSIVVVHNGQLTECLALLPEAVSVLGLASVPWTTRDSRRRLSNWIVSLLWSSWRTAEVMKRPVCQHHSAPMLNQE